MARINAQRRNDITRKSFIKSIAGYPAAALAVIGTIFKGAECKHEIKGACFCRKCSARLIPQKNAKVIFNSKVNSFLVECLKCGSTISR